MSIGVVTLLVQGLVVNGSGRPLVRIRAYLIGVGAALVCATTASAQVTLNQAWTVENSTQVIVNPNGQLSFEAQPDRAFGPAIDFSAPRVAASSSPIVASSRQDIWRDGPGYSERLRVQTRGTLVRADGAPVPLAAGDAAGLDVETYDVSYTRGFAGARGYTESGLEVSLTPHAGIGVGTDGGSAEAGATLKIGSGLKNMVKDGSEAFGQRARWYLYAAGSGRAVGYNFARNRDGQYARSGVSQDSGDFFGDASVGVALRRGAVHGSFGVVYREIEAKDLRLGEGDDNDVTEGLVAFQLSIKPDW